MAPKSTVGVLILICVAAVSLSVADAQSKVPIIGWLGGRTAAGASRGGGANLRRALAARGYIEGKTLAIEYRYANNMLYRLPALADELVRLNVALIIAPTTVEVLAAKRATQTMPIVFYNVPDPVASGLVDSLARPGGNVTGFSTINGLLAGKRLELLKEALPALSRVAVLWDPKNPTSAYQWQEIQEPARLLKIDLHSMEVSSADKYEIAFTEAVKARSGALILTQATINSGNGQRICDLAIKSQLPWISTRYNDYSCALMSYGADDREPAERVAVMVEKILKGVKPMDIPVEQPTRFVFAVNLKTAKQLGLTIPPELLTRAQRVIR